MDVLREKVLSICKYLLLFLSLMCLWGTFTPGVMVVYRGTVGHPCFVLLFTIIAMCVVKLERRIWIILIGLLTVSSLSLLYTGDKISRVVTPIMIISILMIWSSACFSENDRIMISFFSFVTLLFIICYSVGFENRYAGLRALDLEDAVINPNNWGMFTASCYMIWCSVSDLKSWQMKVLDIVLFALSFLALSNYECRTSVVALIFFAVVKALILKRLNYRWIFWCCVLLIAVGVAIPSLYIGLKEFIPQIQFWNKTLYTGRDIIWMNMFDAFAENPIAWLIGLGQNTGIDIERGKSIGVHNSFWHLIVGFGLLYFLFYMSCFLDCVKKACSPNIDYTGKKLILAFCCISFVIGYFEQTFTLLRFSYLGFLPLAMAIDRVRPHTTNA